MENEQASRVAKLWLGDDGIVRIIHVHGAQVTLEDAKETMAAYLKLYKGKRRPLFIDTKTMKSMSRETRQYYAGEEAAKVASVAAIIVGTPVSRVLGNFYIGISNPHLPSRLFTSEDDALEWLKGYLD
ncbi:hypothetical protein [Rhodoferax sp.]|uniref:DUF7793 family protein n=1 Tax=Rhodoferax sp. TaxID=50421 RepID=UPI0026287139|nr:hypothetical protein [Rhodoferax sp.]MDD2920127.1 hypothetical protein [Rhodoferax sp.]